MEVLHQELCTQAISAPFKAPLKLYMSARALRLLDMGTAVGHSLSLHWDNSSDAPGISCTPVLLSAVQKVLHTSLSPSSPPDQFVQLLISISSFNLISDSFYYLRKSKLSLPVLMNHCAMCVGIREQDGFINTLLIKGTDLLLQWLLAKRL